MDICTEALECGICTEPYGDARFLKCGHSFCKDCLQALKGFCNQILCPTCRYTTHLSSKGVDGLPVNFYVSRFKQLLTELKQREEQIEKHVEFLEEKDVTIAKLASRNMDLCAKIVETEKYLENVEKKIDSVCPQLGNQLKEIEDVYSENEYLKAVLISQETEHKDKQYKLEASLKEEEEKWRHIDGDLSQLSWTVSQAEEKSARLQKEMDRVLEDLSYERKRKEMWMKGFGLMGSYMLFGIGPLFLCAALVIMFRKYT